MNVEFCSSCIKRAACQRVRGMRNAWKWNSCLSLALLGMLADGVIASAHGAMPSPADLADLSLEQLSNIVVTSVSRRSERLAGAPAPVFVISSEDIRRSGATTLPEALRLAPNLDVARIDGNQYAITARGFNSALANNLLVLIDGRTVYSPLFSGVYWEAQSIMLKDVDRIEVISGPEPTMWGSNAVNGVINVITRPAAESQGTLVNAVAGNRESGAATRYGGELATGGHYRVYGKYRNNAHTERADGTDVQDGSNHRQTGFRADWGGSTDAFTFQGDFYDADIDQTFGRRDIGGANLLSRWTRSLGRDNDISLQLYYDRTTRDQAASIEEVLDTWDISFQHSMRQHARHAIVWGGGYRYSRDDIENSPDIGFLPPDRELRWSNLFVQDKIALRDELDLTLGIKAEQNIYTGTEWLPSARLAWRMTDDQMLWGRIVRAVRAPARVDREIFVPTSPPFVIAGGPGFKSEVAKVIEVGYRSQPLPSLSYSITLFHSEYDRLRTLETTANSSYLGNKAEATTQGMESWASYRVNRDWRLQGGWTVMNEERRLDPDSTHEGSLSSTLGNDAGHWWSVRSLLDITPRHQFDFALRRVGSRPDPEVPAYTAVYTRFGWKASPGLELSLNVRYPFNPQHPEWGSAATRVEHERSIYLQAEWLL